MTENGNREIRAWENHDRLDSIVIHLATGEHTVFYVTGTEEQASGFLSSRVVCEAAFQSVIGFPTLQYPLGTVCLRLPVRQLAGEAGAL